MKHALTVLLLLTCLLTVLTACAGTVETTPDTTETTPNTTLSSADASSRPTEDSGATDVVEDNLFENAPQKDGLYSVYVQLQSPSNETLGEQLVAYLTAEDTLASQEGINAALARSFAETLSSIVASQNTTDLTLLDSALANHYLTTDNAEELDYYQQNRNRFVSAAYHGYCMTFLAAHSVEESYLRGTVNTSIYVWASKEEIEAFAKDESVTAIGAFHNYPAVDPEGPGAMVETPWEEIQP